MLFYHLQEPGRLSPRQNCSTGHNKPCAGRKEHNRKKPMEENRQQDKKKLSLMEKWDTTRVLAGKAEEAILSLRKHKKKEETPGPDARCSLPART